MNVQPFHIDFLGYAVQFARPDRWPLLLVALLAAGLIAYAMAARRRNLAVLSQSPRLREKMVLGASPTSELLRGIFTAVGLFLFALASLQPQSGQREAKVQSRGIDLVVAIDASRSMLGRDVLPSRLERARLELSRLIDKLHGDRVGIVVFAGQAFVQCPMTSDYGAAKLFLRAIDPGSMPSQGTAIAEALTTAGSMLENADRGASTQAVLLLSDGEDHRGDVRAAARRLADKGIRVFTLGIGTSEGTPVPILDGEGKVTGYLPDRQGQPVVTRLEEAQLREIAELTDGRYVAGRGGDIGMGEIFAELERLEKSDFESRADVRYADIWHWLGFPGFMFLFLGAVLGKNPIRAGLMSLLLGLMALPGMASASLLEKKVPEVAAGIEAFEKEDFEAALQSFDTAAVAHSKLASVHFNRGNALYRLGRFDEAKQAYLEALANRNEQSLAVKDYTNLGNALASLGADEDAMGSWRRALEIDHQASVPRHNLEVLLRRKQQSSEQEQPKEDPEQQEEQEEQQDPEGQPEGDSEKEDPQDEGQGDGEKSEDPAEGDQGEKSEDPSEPSEQKDPQEPEDPSDSESPPEDGESSQNEQEGEGSGSEEPPADENPGEGESSPPEEEGDSQSPPGASQPGDEEPEDGIPSGAQANEHFGDEQEAPADRTEAERLLDSLRDGEKNFQLWRYQKKKGTTHDQKDW